MIDILYSYTTSGRVYTACASRRNNDPLVHDPAWHPKTTLDTLVQSSLIKACAFFSYRQVHLQTTIHQSARPSLQACNKLSKSDLWWQSFIETEWSVSIACIFYPSPFIHLWMNSAPWALVWYRWQWTLCWLRFWCHYHVFLIKMNP